MELEKFSRGSMQTFLRSSQQPLRREGKCMWVKTSLVARWWKLKREGIIVRVIVETGGRAWWKKGETPHTFIRHTFIRKTAHTFIRQTSVLSTCIATCSCKMFSIPIWFSIDIYLILLITIFYKINMIVKLTSWGRTSESWWHILCSLKTMER